MSEGKMGRSSTKRQDRTASWLERGREHPGPSSTDHPVLHLQRSHGNQAVQRLVRSGVIQPKLRVNDPGDRHEQEADRIADQVVAMPVRHAVSGTPLRIQRVSGQSNRQLDVAPASVDQTIASPGNPLEPALRQDMEQRFGYDFSGVRVHSDPAAEQSARDINARAYTVGQDIVFGRGQFAPRTHEGKRLLAHELAHTLQQIGGTSARIARQPTDPRHARGFSGEQGMGFIHYRRENGWIFFQGPSGSAGHGVTESGFDGVAYNVRTGEIHLVDNKSLARQGNVGSATAIDPSKNLGKNLDGLIQRVEAAKDVPGRIRLLGRLRALKASLTTGKPWPTDVKLVVTGVGGQSTGVTGRLQSQGVEFRPEPGPKSQTPAAPAKPPAATVESPAAPPGPKVNPAPDTSTAKTSIKPPTTAPTTPTKLPPATEVIPVPGGKIEPHPSPAPATAPPSTAPVTAPPVRPTSAWKVGLKAGGKALGVALAFAGLSYFVHSRLQKDLEASIEKARKGAMPWAQRVKREDPSKPVYMRVTVRSAEYNRFVPLLGWMPESPKLHMTQIALVREEIDPPIVEVQDNRLDVWRPGIETTVTYTELMVP